MLKCLNRSADYDIVLRKIKTVVQERKQSQQSYRIRSRRALMQSGPRWAARSMKNRIKRTAMAYTTSRSKSRCVGDGFTIHARNDPSRHSEDRRRLCVLTRMGGGAVHTCRSVCAMTAGLFGRVDLAVLTSMLGSVVSSLALTERSLAPRPGASTVFSVCRPQQLAWCF